MVGRILYLKNNHIPPSETDLKSEYTSFGSYDGITIGENVFKNEQDDLSEIWVQSVRDTIEMSGGYSSQAMYLFSDADENTDEFFWKNYDLPILFLIAIQLNKRNNDLLDVRKIIVNKIQEYCTNNKILAQITSYLMLDENDIMLAVKCNNYRLGKIITSSLHKKDNGIVFSDNTFYASYSFTITGIKENASSFCIDGIPEVCQIQIIERYPGTVDELKIKENKEVYPIFGRDDNLLKFKPESWESILSLYRQDGQLSNGLFFRKRFLSVSTRFLCKIDDNEKIVFGDGKTKNLEGDKDKSKICHNLKKKIEQLYRENIAELSKREGNAIIYNLSACYKAIWQILNSIEKFEKKAFPDYIYISIFSSLSMLISKIIDRKEKNETKSNLSYLNNIEEIYSFLTAINQISQNLVRAERQFTQIPELNANCYNIPIKLHAFYAGFVDKVKCYLNESFGTGNYYEFTLYPGINEQLTVTQVFYKKESNRSDIEKENKRLILMNIPEKQVFDPKHMLICLCHEVGHFVGSKLRQRERRYLSIKHAAARLICLHLYCDRKIKKYITQKGLTYLFDYIYVEVARNIENQLALQKSKSCYSDDILVHTEFLEIIIAKGINDFVLKNVDITQDVYEKVLTEYIKEESLKNAKLTREDIKKYKEEYSKALRSYFYNIQSETSLDEDNVSINAISEHLILLYKESFADLVSVLILDLNFREYCQSIFKSLKEYETEEMVDTDLVIRVVLVAITMGLDIEDLKDHKIYKAKWNLNDIYEWKHEERNKSIKKFLEKVIQYYKFAGSSYKNEKNDSVYERLNYIESNTAASVFRDYELLYYLYDYLGDCRLTFEKNRNKTSEHMRLKIKESFEMLTKKHKISEKITYINYVNEEYDVSIRERLNEALY